MPEPDKTLVLIDGHALAYRVYFALPAESFSAGGEITNAIYGFTRVLLDILLDMKPAYFAVAFDAGLSGRDQAYAEYKGTREKMPDDLRPQIARIQEIIRALNIPLLMVEGWEADDVIGTAAAQAEAQGVAVHIITGDRDLLQLLTEQTNVQLPGKRAGEVQVYDAARFRAEYGLEPRQLPDLKGLMGDKSDNIPGVHGVGEKTGTDLLKAYGSLESVYEHLDEIKGAKQKYLTNDRANAFLSKDLATIRRDAPVTLDLPACIAEDYDPAPVLEIFRALNFRAFAERLAPAPAPAVGQQLSMFDDIPPPPSEKPEAAVPGDALPPTKTFIVDDPEKLAALAARLAQAGAITVDTETTGTDQMAVDLVGVAVTGAAGEGFYIPVGHLTGEPQLPTAQVIEALRPALTDPDIPKYGHNIKYDYVVLKRAGLAISPIAFDTMVAAWVVNPGDRLGLKRQAWQRLDANMTDIEHLIGSGKNQITMAQVPVKGAAPYAAADVDMTHRLVADLTDNPREAGKPTLKSADDPDGHMWKLFKDIEMPLVPVLAEMEMHGVMLDAAFLHEMSKELSAQIAALEQDIYARVGYEFNISSTQQLSEALFDKMGLPREGLKKTSGGAISTAAGVLESILVDGTRPEIIDLILDYRELTKLQSTYVEALPQLVNPKTGRLHTSFNQTGTVTGRISSSDPNLQNIPIRTPTGARVRRAFIAPEGCVLLACDYSQVELRVLAHACQDPGLLKAFREGQDIHAATAATVFNVPIETVTKQQRSFAKRVNFGLLYGMGAYRLARETELTFAESEKFIKKYFDSFPNVRQYLEGTKDKAAKLGYVETLLGRRRYFPTLQSQSAHQQVRQRAEREAINMPIQGTAADIIKIAMIDLDRALRERGLGGRMILQVHDELVLEVPTGELEATAALVKTVMEAAYKLDAPLVVDANAGPNWGEMQRV
ncbi:MAG: DNA polymerase I [Anaerolineae bacterium]|nr:DNA polymerase I [Anaerolineae bacterium]